MDSKFKALSYMLHVHWYYGISATLAKDGQYKQLKMEMKRIFLEAKQTEP
jgi:hypothetical protein